MLAGAARCGGKMRLAPPIATIPLAGFAEEEIRN